MADRAGAQLCALYVRLSKEDRREGGQYSDSIINQIELLKEYASSHFWCVFDVYIDDDESGAYVDRPGFQRMLRDAEQGAFGVVIAKTQSRFTRSMADLESILHERFAQWGVRFIGVVDHTDTADDGNKKSRQIHGLTNEWYLEDMSKSIRSVLDIKRRNGQHIGNWGPYGYSKNPAKPGSLIIDEAAADIVRRIFSLYVQGNSSLAIVRLLNDEGVPSPSAYKLGQGINIKTRSKTGLWSKDTVLKLLKNRMYIGDMVQGYQRKESYKSRKQVRLPEDERIVVQGTHEPIVDEGTFDTVQQMLRGNRRRTTQQGEPHILAGKLRCMECGHTITKRSYTPDQHKARVQCKRYALGGGLCTPHRIRLGDIINAVDGQLQALLAKYMDKEYILNNLREANHAEGRLNTLEKQIKAADTKLAQLHLALKNLYLDKSCGKVSAGEYEELHAMIKDDVEKLKTHRGGTSMQLAKLQKHALCKNDEKELLQQGVGFNRMTGVIVRGLIDYIEIGEDVAANSYEVAIHWRF